ncbi:hypothetical protein SCLCIDRAFT_19056 [Scleroderma citrinum Foug A]|uniref:Uncharacterized protein n=1 Tax=Scleroderma citrinum Foug A TaxID=1036808 RepID=A0A0C3EQN9_9AGAM|nr:hypothetical protein SCLCIDRAFT_19056 [Scleroderma citrinum Foug A]
MIFIIGAFVLAFDDAYAWASKHAPDEMDLKEKEFLSSEIDQYFERNGMPQQATGISDGGGQKILIITNSAVISRKKGMLKFKYGRKARRTQEELFDPHKDELPSLKNPLFITMEHPYKVVADTDM